MKGAAVAATDVPGGAHHVSVLLTEVVAALAPRPGGAFIDGTVGAGGHAEALLRAAGPGARLLGLDADPAALALTAGRLAPFGDVVTLVHSNFRYLAAVAARHGITAVDGVLLDLGVSTMQLTAPGRGFTFSDATGLDMRFGHGETLTAAEIVNGWAEAELAALIYRNGDDPAARVIARAVVAARPVGSAAHLAAVIARAVGRKGRTHPATRTFQAIRMEVNRELEAVAAVLPQALTLLRPGGRLAVISFHSGEDRVVKSFIARESRDCICPPGLPECRCGHVAQLRAVSRGAIRPSELEVRRNPASRSARLRVAERLGGPPPGCES